MAQHLHQAGAEPIPGFLGRDQEYVSRDVGCWPRRRHAGKTGHEKARGVRRLDHGLGIGDHRVASNDRNPGQPRRGGALDGPRPHGREVEPQILAALGGLHQHATRRRGTNPAFGAQPRHPRQQPVGALDVLHPDDVTVDDNSCLADVEAAERMQHVTPPGNIGQRILVRNGSGQASLGHQKIGGDIPDSDHPEAVLFENVGLFRTANDRRRHGTTPIPGR